MDITIGQLAILVGMIAIGFIGLNRGRWCRGRELTSLQTLCAGIGFTGFGLLFWFHSLWTILIAVAAVILAGMLSARAKGLWWAEQQRLAGQRASDETRYSA